MVQDALDPALAKLNKTAPYSVKLSKIEKLRGTINLTMIAMYVSFTFQKGFIALFLPGS